MKRLFTTLVLLSLTITLSLSQGFLHADGTRIVNEKNEEVILKGIGLGGWMLQEGYMLKVEGIGQQQHVIRDHIAELIGAKRTDEFYNAWLANHTRKIDIDSMAAWGFNSVRLPMHYNLYTLSVEAEAEADKNTWLQDGFARTDSLLKWCKANKMYLILDLHATPGGQGNDVNISDRDPGRSSLWQSEANRKKVIAFWTELAKRYVNEPWIGAYDIINEPNWGFNDPDKDRNGCGENENAPLRKLMMEITAAIREIDKKHIIVIEGNCWGNNYRGVLPPWDNNMVLSFHKYWNYNDQSSIQGILDLRKQYNIPIWLGETGENSNSWFRDAIYLMDKNKIGWAWWPLKKLGHNNPLQVKTPPLYQQLLDYWKNKGPAPTAEEAYEGLMQLAENLKLENCIYHPDVIDAMMRQPYSNRTFPYKPHQARVGLTIPASSYDLGRNRYAYFDLDTGNYWVANGGKHSAGNRGYTFRNDGVDISYDDEAGFIVTDIEDGEWIRYTVNSSRPASYSLDLVVSSAQTNGQISVSVNGKELSVVNVPDTKLTWKAARAGKISLKKGDNIVIVKAVKGGYRFSALKLEK